MTKIIIKTLIPVMLFLTWNVYAQDYEGYIGGNFMLTAPLDAPKRYCLDLEGYAFITDTSAPVIVHSCKEGFFKDGTWKVDTPRPGNIYIPDYALCVTADSLQHNADVFLKACTDSPLQDFDFRDDGKVAIRSGAAETFCLAVSETSRVTGNNLRRQTRMVNCAQTHEHYTQWIVPYEDTVYPTIEFTPVALLPEGAHGGPGGGRPGGMGGPMGMGMGMGPGQNHLYVGACSPCHGISGQGYASEFSPKISGQERWYLSRQLANYVRDIRGAHEDERWARQMNFHIKDFSQAQLDSFVDYVMTLEDTPAEVSIEGDTDRGQQLYTQFCTACHAEDGMGNELLNSPRLAGMSDWYMVIQLQKFRDGYRGVHPDDIYGAQMLAFAKILPDEQALRDVTAYINTLSPR